MKAITYLFAAGIVFYSANSEARREFDEAPAEGPIYSEYSAPSESYPATDSVDLEREARLDDERIERIIVDLGFEASVRCEAEAQANQAASRLIGMNCVGDVDAMTCRMAKVLKNQARSNLEACLNR